MYLVCQNMQDKYQVAILSCIIVSFNFKLILIMTTGLGDAESFYSCRYF